jgi:hypothetical protein
VEERLQRRLSADADEEASAMPRSQRGTAAESVEARGTVASPIRQAPSTRLATEPSIIEIAPDLSNIRLKRSAFWPILLLLLLAGGGAGAYYYLSVVKGGGDAAAADAGPARRRPPAVGAIHLTSQPEGAAVWLRLGRAPLTSIPVDPSRPHLVRVEHDGYLVKDVVVEPTAFQADQAELSVSLEPIPRASPIDEPTALPGGDPGTAAPGASLPRGRIRVMTDPAAATVWLLVAITPGRTGRVSTAAPIDLRLAKNGHLPDFATLSPDAFDAAGLAQLARDLAPRPSP